MPPRVAEGVRFELTRPFGLPVFKTGAINHSTTPPKTLDREKCAIAVRLSKRPSRFRMGCSAEHCSTRRYVHVNLDTMAPEGNKAKKKLVPVVKEAPQSSFPVHGRGASWSPANRFEKLHVDLTDVDVVDIDPDGEERPRRATQYFRDGTKSIITRNSSPDVGFETSLNPYRGCEHGCIYCYARPTHEYLGFSAGLDFESKIMVKTDAPQLLRAELESPRWQPQVLVMSGVTDPYQPIEKKLRITRSCLEVLAKFRNPVAIITKNRLVASDVDLLCELARHSAAAVNISVTSLDPELQRVLEPRTSPPSARLEVIEKLQRVGVPVGVMVAPIIPGLTDYEVPKILEACAKEGAQFAGYTIVRLPWAVAPLFEHWLEEHFPERKQKILGRIRDLRGNNRLNNSQWHERMTGEGIFAEQIASLFEVSCRRVGIGKRPKLSTASFRRTREQLNLQL
jgi:DNA repair photolyase